MASTSGSINIANSYFVFQIDWSISSTSGTTQTVSATLKAKTNGGYTSASASNYYITANVGGTDCSYSAGGSVGTGWTNLKTVTRSMGSGAGLTISMSASPTAGGSAGSKSTSWTLPTLASKGVLSSVGNVTIGGTPTISATAGTNATRYATLNDNGSGAEQSWTYGVDSQKTIPAGWASSHRGVKSFTAFCKMEWKNGSTSLGYEQKNFTVNIQQTSPYSITSATTPTAEASNNPSKFSGWGIPTVTKITIPAISYGTSGEGTYWGLSEVQGTVKLNGVTKFSYGKGGTSFTPTESGTYTVELTVKDDRGYTVTASSKTFQIFPYTAPNATNVQVERVGKELKLTFTQTGTSSINGIENVITSRVVVNGKTATLATGTGTKTVQTTTLNLEETKTYAGVIEVVDEVGKKVSVNFKVKSPFVLFDLHKGKNGGGVGIGKYHEKGSLDINGDIYLGVNKLGEDRKITSDSELSIITGFDAYMYNQGSELIFEPYNGNTHLRAKNNDRNTGSIPYAELYLGNASDSVIEFANSRSIYNRTSSAAANVGITSGWTLFRSTSASKYKLSISEVQDRLDLGNRLLTVEPKKWFDKTETEDMAMSLTDGVERNQAYTPQLQQYYGLIAEDLNGAGLDMFLTKNKETGEIEGIEYAKLWTLLLPLIKEQREEIIELKRQVYKLEKAVENHE
ncbi:hypothetical protein SAMN02745116_01787 [Pilibacter termitis]|uniref:Peptidase S74 domain-containing protein n=1 Tax=Pilibacter termitis TaxID=263852 RepID=A0A1T4PEN1_9ENTE|nr:hypothetical protein [Pilibacter termitis]SJZ90025.1 hypothetical protein SAMN02745116_01787 [Pilibacter termitis]